MTRKSVISAVLALVIAGVIIYVVQTHARPWVTFGALLAGIVLSMSVVLLRNKFVLFIDILVVALLAYFSWKWTVWEVAVAVLLGVIIGGLLVWGWVSQYMPYRHSEYKANQHNIGDDIKG